MKIGIIDISKISHHTYLNCLANIFNNNNLELYLSSFLKQSLKKTLSDKKYKKIEKIKVIERVSLIKTMNLIKEINNSEVEFIFINTLQNNYFFYLLLSFFLKKKIILSIHNINAFYKQPKSLKGKIRFILRKLILSKCKYINVYGNNMRKYLLEKDSKKIITTLPFSYFEKKERKEKRKEKKLKIVIPGGFETRRRDYKLVYEAIKHCDENIEVTILGKLIDINSVNLFNKFKVLNNVKTFDNFIDELEFDKIMSESDIILGPTMENIEFEKGVKERYGITKETGFTFAQITYGKPGLTPNYIEIMEELKSSTLTYKTSEELFKIIVELENDKKKILHLKDQALKNSKNYTKDKIKKRFENEIKY